MAATGLPGSYGAATTGPAVGLPDAREFHMPSRFRSALAPVLLFLATLPAACAAPRPHPADAPVPPAVAQAEFDRLYLALEDAHYDLFARRPRADYDALHRRMRAAMTSPMTPGALRREFQRFVAYGDVAHASIDPPMAGWEAYRAAGGTAFPLYLRVVGARVVVEDDYSGVAGIAVGDEVLSIDGLPALEWLGRIRGLVSADNDHLAYTQLETRLPMLAWWHGDRASHYAVETATPTGGRRTFEVPARSRSGFEAASAAAPARFELDWNARAARMAGGGVGYLRPGPFYDTTPGAPDPWDPTRFRSFVDGAFSGFIDAGAKAVLIDLRNNPGGDNSFSDPLVAWFADRPFRFSPEFDIRVSEAAIASNARRLQAAGGNRDTTSAKLAAAYAGQVPGSRVSFPIPWVQPRSGARFSGPVYMLVNRHSYSNAVLVAAIAQDFDFATVLGEETADLASTYGAAEKFTLPAYGHRGELPEGPHPAPERRSRGPRCRTRHRHRDAAGRGHHGRGTRPGAAGGRGAPGRSKSR